MLRDGTTRLLRTINRSAVLELVRENSPISRSQIAKQLNISLPTVMRIVDDLMAERLVRQSSLKETTKGRPASFIEFNGEAFAIVGVDLGGTKIYGMVADLAGNVQYSLYRTHEENQANSAGDYLDGLCEFIEELLAAPRPSGQRVRGIGVGAPAITLVPEGIVAWAPSLNWRNLPLQAILTDHFDVPVTVENDVNLAALGEWGFGAGKDTCSMVSITLGTGIGAGIIIDGAIYRGCNQAAGEVGYMLPAPRFLEQRYEGFGALETLASGTGIARRAHELLEERQLPFPEERLDARYVFAQAELGVEWAQQVVDETVDYLALAIANISTVLDPEMIVLGGGVASNNPNHLLVDPIRQRLEGVIPFIPRLEVSELGREAAVMGAIMHVMKATDEYVVVKQLT